MAFHPELAARFRGHALALRSQRPTITVAAAQMMPPRIPGSIHAGAVMSAPPMRKRSVSPYRTLEGSWVQAVASETTQSGVPHAGRVSTEDGLGKIFST